LLNSGRNAHIEDSETFPHDGAKGTRVVVFE
jgi:hypothetical protein